MTITSKDESDYVVELIKDEECDSWHDAWIGLHDAKSEGAAEEGDYNWVDNEPFRFTNWCPGQPDNGGNEDYGEIWIDGDYDGCWNDNQKDTNGPNNGADNDKFVVEYDCEDHGAGSSGDPHFETFGGFKYDFHGGCDLDLYQNPEFANGLGLNVQIRTNIKVRYHALYAASIWRSWVCC